MSLHGSLHPFLTQVQGVLGLTTGSQTDSDPVQAFPLRRTTRTLPRLSAQGHGFIFREKVLKLGSNIALCEL